MRHGLRYYHVLAGALGAAACAFGAARGADDPKTHNKPYEFESADGVKLAGNLWSNSGQAQKKDATIILLHDMTNKGGSSRDDGWDDLAEKLLGEGYSVFSFDFRGHGQSTKVNPEKFWDLRKNPQNQMVKGFNKRPPPENIDKGDFEHTYYPYLVNDVAAAKAFLDRRNDSGEVNTSSTFVIGAGQGATIGALWMASQWHLQRGILDALGNVVIDKKTLKYSMQDAEGNDQAGAIWLSINPTLAGRPMTGSVHSWVGEVGGADRVPMAFLYGAKDDAGKKAAGECLDAVVAGYRRASGAASLTPAEATEKKDEDTKARATWKLADTFKFGIAETDLSGSALLGGVPTTTDTMIKTLNHIMKDRKNLESRKRDNDGAAFFWTFGSSRPLKAKEPMDPTLPIIDTNVERLFIH